MTQSQRDEIVRVATNNTYLSEIDLNKFAHQNYVKRIKKIIDGKYIKINGMSTEEFYNRHASNGGDLAKWDGTLPPEPTTERKANPSLKRYNYIFENALTDSALDVEVIDPEIVKE
jgi:hypothetical protein